MRKGARIVCITGMHCSGTSAIARIVNLFGVDLGPPEVGAPARRSNTKGLWEYPALTRVGERILNTLGGTWSNPPSLAPGWQHAPELDRHRDAALEVIETSFGESSLWGWKDPRSSLLSPFWEKLLGELDYVICVRHPADVAASLQRRDELDREHSVALWLRYMGDVVSFTRDRRRVIVCFDDLWGAGGGPLEDLAAFLGRPGAATTPEFRAAVADWLEDDLWHHRGGATSRHEDDLPAAASDLYRALRAGAAV